MSPVSKHLLQYVAMARGDFLTPYCALEALASVRRMSEEGPMLSIKGPEEDEVAAFCSDSACFLLVKLEDELQWLFNRTA
jgi:hypothetical protein